MQEVGKTVMYSYKIPTCRESEKQKTEPEERRAIHICIIHTYTYTQSGREIKR